MERKKVLAALNEIDRGAVMTVTLRGGTIGRIARTKDGERYEVLIGGKISTHKRETLIEWLEGSARKVRR